MARANHTRVRTAGRAEANSPALVVGWAFRAFRRARLAPFSGVPMRLLSRGACLVVAAMVMTSCDTSCDSTSPVVTVNPTPTAGATATPTTSGFTVTITIGGGDGTGIVTANPPGPNYPPGTVVTLTATADAGSCFGGWTASCEVFGQKAVCTVTISASTKVGAEFDKVCSTPTPAPTPTKPSYCHSIVGASSGGGGIPAGTCPTGATQFCDTVPIVATNSAQAHAACDACYGAGVCGNGNFGASGGGEWAGVANAAFIYLPTTPNALFCPLTGVSYGPLAGEIDDNAGCPLVPPSRWAP
jgi:hypothetical protein